MDREDVINRPFDENDIEGFIDGATAHLDITPVQTARDIIAAEAIRYLKVHPSATMMSFGYGDDPEDFDSIGLEELEEAVAEDGVSEVNDTWGPFAPWLN